MCILKKKNPSLYKKKKLFSFNWKNNKIGTHLCRSPILGPHAIQPNFCFACQQGPYRLEDRNPVGTNVAAWCHAKTSNQSRTQVTGGKEHQECGFEN